MRRRLFTLCSALSLLLCLAACVLWVGTYFGATYRSGASYQIAAHRGVVYVAEVVTSTGGPPALNVAAWALGEHPEGTDGT